MLEKALRLHLTQNDRLTNVKAQQYNTVKESSIAPCTASFCRKKSPQKKRRAKTTPHALAGLLFGQARPLDALAPLSSPSSPASDSRYTRALSLSLSLSPGQVVVVIVSQADLTADALRSICGYLVEV